MCVCVWGGWFGLGGVRVNVNEELKFYRKFKIFFLGGGGSRGSGCGGGGGQDGYERRIEFFVKIQKKIGGESGGSRVGGSGGM